MATPRRHTGTGEIARVRGQAALPFAPDQLEIVGTGSMGSTFLRWRRHSPQRTWRTWPQSTEAAMTMTGTPSAGACRSTRWNAAIDPVALMAPSGPHELSAVHLVFLVEAAGRLCGIRAVPTAGTTWKPRDIAGRQVEADGSWYFGETAERYRAARRMRRSGALVAQRDPVDAFNDANPPQLVAEVERSHADPEKPGIYRALGVIEMWRIDESGFRLSVEILDLQAPGGPRPLAQSSLLPGLTPAVIAAGVEVDDSADMPGLLRAAGIGTEPFASPPAPEPDPEPDDMPGL